MSITLVSDKLCETPIRGRDVNLWVKVISKNKYIYI